MKKVQLKMWKSARESVKHKLAGQVVELKNGPSVFAHMLNVARLRPKINLKKGIGQHEFTCLPRALFTVSGELLLEELPKKTSGDQQPAHETNDTAPLPPRKVTVIDGMAVVQAMDKPPWSKHVPSGQTTSQPHWTASAVTSASGL